MAITNLTEADAFVRMVARLDNSDEMDMGAEDAIHTVNSLIDKARMIVHRSELDKEVE